MQALHPTEAPAVTISLQTVPNRSLESSNLFWLVERLRIAYGPVEALLPGRLSELAERLARREQPTAYEQPTA